MASAAHFAAPARAHMRQRTAKGDRPVALPSHSVVDLGVAGGHRLGHLGGETGQEPEPGAHVTGGHVEDGGHLDVDEVQVDELPGGVHSATVAIRWGASGRSSTKAVSRSWAA